MIRQISAPYQEGTGLDGTINLETDVTGILPPANGGTGSANVFGTTNTWTVVQNFTGGVSYGTNSALGAAVAPLTDKLVNFVFEGDSMTEGAGPTDNYPYFASSKSFFTGRNAVVNVAVAGATLADITSQYAAEVFPHRPAGSTTRAYLFVYIGTNDYLVVSAATWLTSWASYMTTAKADGFTVVVFTVTGRTTDTVANETNRVAMNSGIRASALWDYLVDVDSIFPDHTDTAWYFDGTHFTTAANVRLGTFINYTLSGYLYNPSYGQLNPMRGMLSVTSALSATGRFVNVVASSPTAGALVTLSCNDGAALASGDRLGALGFGGSTNASTQVYPILLQSFAEEAWSVTAAGAGFRIFTTPLTTLVPVEAARYTAAGNFCLGATSVGANGTRVFCIGSGVASGGVVTDAIQMWSGDRNSVAGKASLQMLFEDGTRSVIGDRTGFGTANPGEALEVVGNILSAGTAWTIRTSAADNNWISVCYGNGRFVAVAITGSGNRVMTSPDGTNWTIRSSAANNSWYGVCYGTGIFVAVAITGSGNRVMTSPDGITWTTRTSAADNEWVGVCYGNGLFVAVAQTGSGNRVMTSPDGIVWTIRTSASDNNWTSICFGNSLFVAVGQTGASTRVMTSPDGITWTTRTSAADNSWYAVCYGNGLFVAVAITGSSNRVMTSPDGTTWTARTSAADVSWISVCYGSGLFVAVAFTGTGNRVMTSPDGSTWVIRTSAADVEWLDVCYGNGLFVAVSDTGTGNRVMTSGKPLDTVIPSNNIFQGGTTLNGTTLFFPGLTGNVGIGLSAFGTSANRVIGLASGTAPSTSVTDAVQLWSEDRGATAGKASLFIRTEDGTSHVFGDRSGIGTVIPSVFFEVNESASAVDGTSMLISRNQTGLCLRMHNTVASGQAYSKFTNSTTGTGTFTDGILLGLDTDSSGVFWNYENAPFRIGTNNAERVRVDSSGNFGLGLTAWGTSAAKNLALSSGTAPGSSIADGIAMWSADRNAVAGKASLHIRTEDATSHVFGDLSGINTVTPNSTLQIAGSVATAYATQTTATLALDATHSIIAADTTSNGITITLPTAVGITGRQYTIKRVSAGANTLTLATTSSQTIDGATTLAISAQYTSVTVVSNNANWLVV